MEKTAALQTNTPALRLAQGNSASTQDPMFAMMLDDNSGNSGMMAGDADTPGLGGCDVIIGKPGMVNQDQSKSRLARRKQSQNIPLNDVIVPRKKPPVKQPPIDPRKMEAAEKAAQLKKVGKTDETETPDAAATDRKTCDQLTNPVPTAEATDVCGLQTAAITIEDLLADIAAAIPVAVVDVPVEATAAAVPVVDAQAASDTLVATSVAATPLVSAGVKADTKLASQPAALPADNASVLADVAVPAALPAAAVDAATQPERTKTAQAVIDEVLTKLPKKAGPEIQELPAPAHPIKTTPPVVPTKVDHVDSGPDIYVAGPGPQPQPPVIPDAQVTIRTDVRQKTAVLETGGIKPAPGAVPTAAAIAEQAIKVAQPYEANAKLAAVKVANAPALIEQVAVRLNHAAKNGDKSISIQLHPAELGRIEVKLDATQTGQARVTVTTDTAQTLELLQKDRSGLERALSDAGMKLDNSSLTFNLRDGGQQNAFDHMQREANGPQYRAARELREAAELPPLINIAVGPDLASGRVDIRA